ncbi:lasso peptide biosynthesis B2 protein [Rhizobium mongolense]|uniref:lasso peptide biosynthesis B2 protein n=1 Tax=Rhizobium mongolense TaxID=57676 RepID=UPI003555D478
MVYTLKKHLRAASCNEDIVILDLQTDRFHILNDVSAERMNSAMNAEDPALAEALHEAGLIEHSDTTMSVTPRRTNGFFEQRWMTPIVNATCSWKDKLLAGSEVVRTNRKLKRATMDEILFEIRRTPPVQVSTPQSEGSRRLASLMAALNVAFGFDRTGNQCLAYSYSLARMARKLGIPASLVIGVRTKPFLSHAWVECGNEVVNDDPLLREKLSVIAES